MSAEEDILALMRMRGPILPADAAKVIKTNLIFAGAHLSELASRGKVKISHVKVGGSPVYYIPGHEARLLDYAKNLDEKEIRVLEHLKNQRVLREVDLDPLTRVALRNIKDFAVPLTVRVGSSQETFWKWYLLNDEDTAAIIRVILEPPVPVVEEKKDAVAPLAVASSGGATTIIPLPIPATAQLTEPERSEVTHEKKGLDDKVKKTKSVQKRKEEKSTGTSVPLSQSVRTFFESKGIRIIREDSVRKDAEMNFVLEVPSAVGYLRYLCHALGKKKCTDKDLSAALVDGQLKKIPVIFLYPGDLTPKAEELAKTEMFRTMVVTKLGH